MNEASERQENQWLSPVLALLGYCFIVIGAVSSLCLLPMLADAALIGFAHPEDGPKWAVEVTKIARRVCRRVLRCFHPPAFRFARGPFEACPAAPDARAGRI